MDTLGIVGEYMYGHTGGSGGVHVWTHMVVGEYMYGHTGYSGGVHVWTHRG